ncbi:MAG: HAMP domain-containing histidine kinase [Anaerolineae bacterium]|nr:HAMP domain-containing histidine kinase [Anaerolineae bacterium]
MDELQALQARTTELEAELAALHASLDAHLQLTQLLRQFDRQITSAESLSSILGNALSWLGAETGATSQLVAQWVPDRQLFEVMASFGRPLGLSFQVEDVFSVPEKLRPHPELVLHESIVRLDGGTLLSAELRRSDGSLLGLLLLQRDADDAAFVDEEMRFIKDCAERLAFSMHHAMLYNRVEALNRYRAQLFRMLSHDLRQPLTVLMGYIPLLRLAHQHGNLTAAQEYMGHMDKSAKDLSTLLEEVLLKEQVENPTREDWVEVGLRPLVDEALDKHQAMANLKQHRLELALTDQPSLVRGVSLQLREAAANLISNGIKYTPEGGHVRVSLWVEDGRVYFQVDDNGYGISKERQARLFESFYRAQEPGTENIKGTGLGLSLVKGIVENHDGEVFFQSEPGQGSSFGFWLPIIK